ncbi:MAG: type II secretion system F family protein [Candidatus Paceibacterota bacterium]|jgi:type II secretory pathway component PulF
MALYQYEAVDKKGKSVKGDFEAPSKDAVVEFLSKRGLFPVVIGVRGEKKLNADIALFDHIRPIDKILLVRNLGATIKAGLSLIEALDILIVDTTKKPLKNILIRAKSNLENGQPLSSTFAEYKKDFPAIFVGLLRAGEASGRLDTTLEELSHHLVREYGLVRKIRSALAYPILLLTASVGVVVLLLTFVLPRLVKTFAQSGAELPAVTRALMSASEIALYSPTFDVIFVAILIWFFTFFSRTEIGKKFFDRFFLRIPIANDLLKKISLVRFTRTLSSLIKSGTPIVDALHLSADSLGNILYRTAIITSVEQVRNGVPLSHSLEQYPHLFPKFLTSLILVGEKTGTLEGILKTFSEFYDEEVDASLKELTTLLEPLLLLFMGLMIGTIAIAVLMPIYQLIGKFR